MAVPVHVQLAMNLSVIRGHIQEMGGAFNKEWQDFVTDTLEAASNFLADDGSDFGTSETQDDQAPNTIREGE